MNFSSSKYGSFSSLDVEKWFKDNPYECSDRRKSNLVDLIFPEKDSIENTYEFEIPNVLNLRDIALNSIETDCDRFFAIVFLLKALGIENPFSSSQPNFFDTVMCRHVSSLPRDLNYIRKLDFAGYKITTQFIMCFISTHTVLRPIHKTEGDMINNIVQTMSILSGNRLMQDVRVYGQDTIEEILENDLVRNVMVTFFECGWIPFERRREGLQNGHCRDCVLAGFETGAVTFTGIKNLRCACDMEKCVEPLYYEYRESITLFSLLQTHILFPWQPTN